MDASPHKTRLTTAATSPSNTEHSHGVQPATVAGRGGSAWAISRDSVRATSRSAASLEPLERLTSSQASSGNAVAPLRQHCTSTAMPVNGAAGAVEGGPGASQARRGSGIALESAADGAVVLAPAALPQTSWRDLSHAGRPRPEPRVEPRLPRRATTSEANFDAAAARAEFQPSAIAAAASAAAVAARLDLHTATCLYRAPLDADANDNSASECAICMERFQEGERIRILPCVHRYHARCVDRWLLSRWMCPICKHAVVAG
eukprot:gnl/TRDRNA2_/TRDRNA2_38682_c1_seq1.p1 gnl/TRDRNA2_/TRDRNA2_38682_c1~~gnl/TRDRNA2_/TRDRNA2_38682_c1_seq1.p1  ORF type:complete len:292 (-),score=28.57 gnl/TRDRNA2_/TRDRNA2_38682_c1_seq1:197-979(-)